MTDTDLTPLRLWRLTTGRSLRSVAREAGINSGRLSIIERGVPPTPDERRRIEDALRRGPERVA